MNSTEQVEWFGEPVDMFDHQECMGVQESYPRNEFWWKTHMGQQCKHEQMIDTVKSFAKVKKKYNHT